jgi:hypothetical protein
VWSGPRLPILPGGRCGGPTGCVPRAFKGGSQGNVGGHCYRITKAVAEGDQQHEWFPGPSRERSVGALVGQVKTKQYSRICDNAAQLGR